MGEACSLSLAILAILLEKSQSNVVSINMLCFFFTIWDWLSLDHVWLKNCNKTVHLEILEQKIHWNKPQLWPCPKSLVGANLGGPNMVIKTWPALANV